MNKDTYWAQTRDCKSYKEKTEWFQKRAHEAESLGYKYVTAFTHEGDNEFIGLAGAKDAYPKYPEWAFHKGD